MMESDRGRPRSRVRPAPPRNDRRRPFSKPSLCMTLFLQSLIGMVLVPAAIGYRRTNLPAFVATKKNSYRSASTSTVPSTTKLFFDQGMHPNTEQHTNSTSMVLKGVAQGGSSKSKLSASSSSSPATTADGFVDDSNTHEKNHHPRFRLRGNPSYKIYCDMDGCLVNFEKGVRTLLKTGSSSIDKSLMWEGISRAPLWFEQLEWQMDGRRLWSAIKHLNPDILTGVPDIESSRVEKFNWCKRELGIGDADAHHVDMAADGINDHKSVNGNVPRDDKTNIITCWSNNKYKECSRRGSILIDDRLDLKYNWESAGGIFIHHVNTETTIRKLRDLGVISESGLDNGENDWYWEGSWRLWSGDE